MATPLAAGGEVGPLDVVGIGNALVDVLSQEGDDLVERLGLQAGAMTLVDGQRAEQLYAAMGPAVEVSGGSAANTVCGVASLGGRAAYLGKVADDQLGAVFAHDMTAAGVLYGCAPARGGPPTGRCLVVITPDAQRTMSTYLGASQELGPADIDLDLIAAARVTFLEGYLFDRPEAQEAYWKASHACHDHGGQVAFTLSDTFCVERHREQWRHLVADMVDILFANEREAMALYEVGDLRAALAAARADVEVAVITRGARGSVLARGEEVVEVPAVRAERVLDTTGAGDMYAAGFLRAFTSGASLAECGRLGSAAAAAVLGHTGARPGPALRRLAESLSS